MSHYSFPCNIKACTVHVIQKQLIAIKQNGSWRWLLLLDFFETTFTQLSLRVNTCQTHQFVGGEKKSCPITS